MCYPKPGPRCSSHAKIAWDYAKRALIQMADDATPEERIEAQRAADKAKWDYLTTPEGLELLRQAQHQAQKQGREDQVKKFARQIEQANASRNRQMRALRAMDQQNKKRKEKEQKIKPSAESSIITADLPTKTDHLRNNMKDEHFSKNSLVHRTSKQLASRPKAKKKSDGTPVSTDGYGLIIQTHAYIQAETKGFTEHQICNVFAHPENIYPSKSHPGQHRITGDGICLVGEFDKKKFKVITLYADGVVTPPRPEQMETPEGQEFTQRYAHLGKKAREGFKAHHLDEAS